MENNKSLFSLTQSIYAAHFEKAVIVLDLQTNKYISLIDDAAYFLPLICRNAFSKTNESYQLQDSQINVDNKALNEWINYFLEKKFISESSPSNIKYVSNGPLVYGGLNNYQWDIKSSWYPLSKTSPISLIKTLYILRKVHKAIQKGIGPVIDLVQSYKRTDISVPKDQDIKKLSAAVDAAAVLYPQKTLCLAWAATFVILALQKNWDAKLCIGVQINPFYAHAWVEIDNEVINDDSQVAQVLSIIYKS